MLCGEFHRPLPHLSVNFLNILPLSEYRSPYYTLLTIISTMGTPTHLNTLAMMRNEDEDTTHLDNDVLSYENPNYHLDTNRLVVDNINSNFVYDDIYQELDDICNLTSGFKEPPSSGSNRKAYATLNMETMGVDVHTGPLQLLNSTSLDDNKGNIELNQIGDENKKNLKLLQDKPNADELKICDDLLEKVPHIAGQLNNDLYAIPIKKKSPKKITNALEIDSPEKENGEQNDLPPGWEKHEDDEGPYYWHIKSGTIQREPPPLYNQLKNMINNKENDSLVLSFENGNILSSVPRSNTSLALDIEADERKKRSDDLSLKRHSFPSKMDEENQQRPIRFAVHSLGWVEIAEDDLTPEKSSKAVNKCIVDLSIGKNDVLDGVGRWGEGKDLFMDLDEGALKLVDPQNLTALNTQPIHTIRVWGVGRDNGRDFAYVARDRTTRKHMCHVFRCDMPARTIANTLRDICKKIMIERSLQQNLAKAVDCNGRTYAVRPTNLPTEHRRVNRNSQTYFSYSFPTPMEEPKKVLRAQYLGTTQVSQASGMNVLNEAIDRLTETVPIDQWQSVNVAVAPSMISIQEPVDNRTITECRVRYLSFLGIGKNVKHCAFIMHTAQDTFVAHVFHCDPSSGALCKTVEAACKLRYQKCLDAHPQNFGKGTSLHTSGKSIGAALKSIVGSLTGRKSRSLES